MYNFYIVYNRLRMDWEKLESIIGENVPDCIKRILLACGYDRNTSLFNISHESVLQIEQHINTQSRNVIQQFNCCYSEYYKKQKEFKLLPGHFDFICAFSHYNPTDFRCANPKDQAKDSSELPFILKEMLQTAHRNADRDKNHLQYSDTLRFFSTYVFLLGGRSTYELLNSNLPLQSTKTVCKF